MNINRKKKNLKMLEIIFTIYVYNTCRNLSQTNITLTKITEL